jgi:hypothetical protein
MVWVEGISENIATFSEIVLTQLFGPGLAVMTTLTERCELLERRKRIATAPNWSPMVDDGGRLNSADL